ncbi:dihydropteroate synthase [bacterium]|nr:dihydropteroate synthase [candidate division CSSED10-310 bacterium]
MGILNVTPDSFSGDGRLDARESVEMGLRMVEAGADILDVGGESSRPFADPVDDNQEMDRVLPVIRGLREQSDVPISIDTRHVRTARAALDEGAVIVNDIRGLSDPAMRKLIAETCAGTVIMHMQGDPSIMQTAPAYDDVVMDVSECLKQRVTQAVHDGIDPSRIAVDPGIGFGKTLEHNLQLIRYLDRIRVEDCALLLGASRKSMIGALLGVPVNQRLEGSLAAAAAGVCRGADVIRVHDVAETRRFLTVFLNILGDRQI